MAATHTVPSQRSMRAAIRREAAAALAHADAPDWQRWYHDHADTLSAWAEDHGVPMATAVAMAATISPGLDPDTEPAYLSWLLSVDEPTAENRPHGFMLPRGYPPMLRASEVLSGKRGMPKPDIKTGNYGRAIMEPDSPEWVAIDVWAWRTTCGDPLDSKRPLPSFRAGEYAEIRRAWQAVAEECGMVGSALQAVCWCYRRGRA